MSPRKTVCHSAISAFNWHRDCLAASYRNRGGAHSRQEPMGCRGNTHMTDQIQLKILIVHDSPTFRYDVMGILTNRNYQFFQANSGLRAIESTLANYPDIVLLNNELPDMDGLEYLRRVKQNALTEKTRVIMMRDISAESISKEAYHLGCSDFVTVPIVPAELERKIDKLVRFVQLSNTAKEARNTMAQVTLPRRILV